MPKVSIIVPVYNVEATLTRCLESILSQTFSDFELIIVDDGSTDKSSKICDQYNTNSKNITVIHKKNGGLSSARNAGLQLAKGKYVMFLDSDDYVTPDCLEILYKKNADFIIGTIWWTYENGNIINQVNRSDKAFEKSEFGIVIPELLGERRLNYVHAKLYNRKIIVDNNLSFENDMLTSAEDTVFNFNFLKHCNNIFVIGTPVHHYMQSSTGLASKFYYDRYQRFKRLNKYIEETCNQMDIYNNNIINQINIRKVLSAVWCVDGIVNQKSISFKQKKTLLNQIYFDCELKESLLTTNIDGTGDLLYLLNHNSRIFLVYKLINKVKHEIIVFFYRLTPKFIINAYHKLKGNG